MARAALLRSLGDQGFLDIAARSGGVAFLGRTDGFLTGPSEADPARIALDYVRGHLRAFGLDRDDLVRLRLTDRYTSIDGVTHLIWRQRTRGIESYGTFLGANVAEDGRGSRPPAAPRAGWLCRPRSKRATASRWTCGSLMIFGVVNDGSRRREGEEAIFHWRRILHVCERCFSHD